MCLTARRLGVHQEVKHKDMSLALRAPSVLTPRVRPLPSWGVPPCVSETTCLEGMQPCPGSGHMDTLRGPRFLSSRGRPGDPEKEPGTQPTPGRQEGLSPGTGFQERPPRPGLPLAPACRHRHTRARTHTQAGRAHTEAGRHPAPAREERPRNHRPSRASEMKAEFPNGTPKRRLHPEAAGRPGPGDGTPETTARGTTFPAGRPPSVPGPTLRAWGCVRHPPRPQPGTSQRAPSGARRF